MDYLFICFFLAFLGTIIGVGVMHAIKIKKTCEQQKNLNLKAINILKQSSFYSSKVIRLTDCFTYKKENECKKFIAVDDKTQKIALIDYKTNNVVIANFEEIVNYEVYENGSVVTTGGSMGLRHSIFAAETNGMCKELRLIIRLNRLNSPHLVYSIIENTSLNIGLNKSSDNYKNCILSLQEAVSLLEIIINSTKGN